VSVRVPEGGRSLLDAIGDLPTLRSGLSRGDDSSDRWALVVQKAAGRLAHLHRKNGQERFYDEFSRVKRRAQEGMPMKRSSRVLPSNYGSSNDDLRRWLEKRELHAIAQHETRGHMVPDLSRYLFASVFGRVEGSSPKADCFPKAA